MEDLLKKLQEEVGLNEEQAVKAVSIFKDFTDKEGLDINWDKFFRGKYDDLKGHAKSLFDVISSKAQVYSTKLEDKVDDLTIEAKKKVRDLSQKASDYLDNDKKSK